MHTRARLSIPVLALAVACVTEDRGVGPPDAAATHPDAEPERGPYDDVELTREIAGAVSEPVHVVRDELGIPHVHAENPADLFFVQGYVTAHDRIPQMDILRRVGAGTLAELYGTTVIEQDLEMRMHMMTPLAEQTLEALRASDDPADAAVVEMLERYADGVNAYVADLTESGDSLHPAVAATWNAERFEPWTPVDSLVIARFMAFNLSFSAPRQIADSRVFDAAFATFGDPDGSDEAIAARAGAHADLVSQRPVARVATVDGFATAGGDDREPAGADPSRATPSSDAVERALATFSSPDGLPPGLDARSYRIPNAGSNSWALGPEVTGHEAILAGDQHLQLANPSTFYPIHLVVRDDLDVEGVSFPGIPAIALGHNGQVAWSSTVVNHDVTDVYLESIVPCAEGDGDCAQFDGDEVPLETRTETVQIGALGTITDSVEATYEVVPHHGPIIPTVAGNEIVERTDDEALSVRYTGYEVTHELRAFFDLLRAESVDDAFEALELFQYGGQNFVIIDDRQAIGWSTHADIPVRAPAAHTFHAVDNPEGVAPWMILPGDGTAEWEGLLATAHIPRVKNPSSGYLVTANSDPVGATFDGDPLSGPEIDGRPLYLGALYNIGLRTARITARIRERVDEGLPVGLEDTIDTQHDTLFTHGELMMPRLAETFALLDDEGSRPDDVADFLSDHERIEAMKEAAEILAAWSFETPPAVTGEPTDPEITDSVATTLYNAWMHFFIERALDDEFQAMGLSGVFAASEPLYVRTAVALMLEPESLESDTAAETKQSVLCDDMTTEDVVESCDRIALEALDLALQWGQSEDGFDTDDLRAWRWGERHTLTLAPLVPNPTLELGPFPRAGGNDVVNVAQSRFRSLSMRQRAHGPAQRFIAIAEPGAPLRAKIQLPGGTVYDPDSPHYRDLLDETYLPEVHADFPYARDEVVAAGSERWLVRP